MAYPSLLLTQSNVWWQRNAVAVTDAVLDLTYSVGFFILLGSGAVYAVILPINEIGCLSMFSPIMHIVNFSRSRLPYPKPKVCSLI